MPLTQPSNAPMYGGLGVYVMTAALLLTWAAPTAQAQSTLSGEAIRISRAAGAITVEGDLSDEGWRNATRVDKWYETNPGDNVEPPVHNVGYLTYDDRFFYAGFEFDDPDLERAAMQAVDEPDPPRPKGRATPRTVKGKRT